METHGRESNSKTKALLGVMAIIAAIVFITCIILHTNPFAITNYIIDFTIHHYFLMAFISLIVIIFCIKIYTTIDDELKRKFNTKYNIGYTRDNRKNKKIQLIKKLIRFKTSKRTSYPIDKEKIKDLKFLKEEVLETKEELEHRDEQLQKAMKLGNIEKYKVRIYFKDSESNKNVETTIWNVDSSSLTLKGGIVIPICSIYKIEI